MTYRVGSYQIGDDAADVAAMLSGQSYMVGSAYGPERFQMGAWPHRRQQRRYHPPAYHPAFGRRPPPPGYGRMVGYAEIGDDGDQDGPDGGPDSPDVQDAQAAAYGAALARTHTLVRDREPTKSRMYAIGIGTGTDVIPLGATATLSIQPQVLFRPERLVVDATDSANFLILDFKVGKNSQFAAQSPLPASAFQPGAFGVRLKCDTCQISAQLVLQVQNMATVDSRFNACVFGEAVE